MLPTDQILALLRDYQDRRRLTNKQMAEEIGIDETSWSRYRAGERPIPRPGILAGFAKLYKRRMGLVRAFLLDEAATDDKDDAA